MSSVRTLAEEVALIMPRISRKILFDFLQNVNIPHAQLFVIMMLFHGGPSRITDIVKELKVAAPTATGIIDRLEKAGYAKRTPDKKDRRAIVVDLTPKGRQIASKMRSVVVDRWQSLLEKVSREDAEKYVDILRKLKEVL